MKSDPVCYHSTFTTPAGDFCVGVDASGAVCAAAFGTVSDLSRRIRGPVSLVRDLDGKTLNARRQVEAFFSGRKEPFRLVLSPEGTPFQRRVWSVLQKIPFGRTRSYSEVARTLGTSARAVGRAAGANPVCLLIPCHRVIGADGSLTGFAFGEKIKLQLLRMEGSHP